MKTLANVLMLLGLVTILAVITLSIVLHYENKKCDEALTVMTGVGLCMNTPGCFYDADNLVDTKRALSYHQARCKKDPA